MGSDKAFTGLHGLWRVLAEFQEVHKRSRIPNLCCLTLFQANALRWRFMLKNFDEDTPGGAALNADLRELHKRYHQDYLLLEATFPTDYPKQPFFLRVVSPRCVWHTGHVVTKGGSICVEALTQSGTAGSWDPSCSFEGVLCAVVRELTTCDSVSERAGAGPGGVSGSLRIDLEQRYHSEVMRPYCEEMAKKAFEHRVNERKRTGWGGQGASSRRPGARQPAIHSMTNSKRSHDQPAATPSVVLPAHAPACVVQPTLQASPVHSRQQTRAERKLKRSVGHSQKAPVTQEEGAAAKQVPDWVKAKPKPLKKVFSLSPPQSRLNPVDDGLFDEVILLLEKEGEKDKKNESSKGRAAEASEVVDITDPASFIGLSGSGPQASGNTVVETIDLLDSTNDDAPVKLPDVRSTTGHVRWNQETGRPRPPIDEILEAATDMFHLEKTQMMEAWEKERKTNDAKLAEMERQVRMAKSSSKLACDPPSHWSIQHEGQNLLVTELPFVPSQSQWGRLGTWMAQFRACKRSKTSDCRGDGLSEALHSDPDVPMIVDMLQEQGYLERVTRIFRVQNTKLWTKFNLWRNDIRDEVGKSQLNERLLWHGADQHTLGKIANEGFDARVSKLTGALGGGIYFSESMRYSEGYSRMPVHSVGTVPPVVLGVPSVQGVLGVPSVQGVLGVPNVPNVGQKRKMEEVVHSISMGMDPTTQTPVPAAGEMGMILARVVLGLSYPAQGQLSGKTRRAPEGHHSVSHNVDQRYRIHAIYDNPQAYPEFLIYFR